MKDKFFIISIILASVLVLSSCNLDSQDTSGNSSVVSESSFESSDDASSQEDEIYTSDMFFAYKENTKYVFAGEGNEYASYVVFIDFMKEDSVQTRTNNGGTEVVRVIENHGDKLILIRQDAEIYFRESFLEGNVAYLEILLMDPVVVGTKWDVTANHERSITAVNKEITTPYGTFEAVEVTSRLKYKVDDVELEDIVLEYYVKDIGHVKTIFKSAEGSGEEYEIISELSQIQENQKLMQMVDFYFPDSINEKLIVYTRELEFSTNDSTPEFFEEEFKRFPEGLEGKLLSDNTSINFITRKDSETAHIDFSEEFISEMNAGAGFESLILQSVVNTITGYYGVEKVYISVDGTPYSSGHIQIGEDEYFTRN